MRAEPVTPFDTRIDATVLRRTKKFDNAPKTFTGHSFSTAEAVEGTGLAAHEERILHGTRYAAT